MVLYLLFVLFNLQVSVLVLECRMGFFASLAHQKRQRSASREPVMVPTMIIVMGLRVICFRSRSLLKIFHRPPILLLWPSQLFRSRRFCANLTLPQEQFVYHRFVNSLVAFGDHGKPDFGRLATRWNSDLIAYLPTCDKSVPGKQR